MSCGILLEGEQEEEQKEQQSQLEEQEIAVWGANLSSPVVDQATLMKSIIG
jgi:hypothetical protein